MGALALAAPLDVTWLPALAAAGDGVPRLVLQLAVILLAAKLGGELFERWLKQPAVLGELAGGMLVGPYALGSFPLPGVGPLFPPLAATGTLPVPETIYFLAQFASVILLFYAGLETDFRGFIRFGLTASIVGVGGVVLPFAAGAVSAVLAGLAPSVFDTRALILGSLLTATSVGITARILSDIGKLDTPEGVTILTAAVVDDVLGILVLAVVLALESGVGGGSLAEVALTGGRALGVWVVLTGLLIALGGVVSRALGWFHSSGAALTTALALAAFSAFVAQSAGLALIIGAYSAGLALSRTRARELLVPQVRPVYETLVPVFFVVMGMLVDFRATGPLLGFGLLLSVVALLTKLVGCGLPALALGFRPLGALRIGVGMAPRGEVALIIAGLALTSGLIGADLFGVAVLVTLVTTVPPPALLVPIFQRGGSGLRQVPTALPLVESGLGLNLPGDLFRVFLPRFLQALESEGFRLALQLTTPTGEDVYELQRGGEVISLQSRVQDHEVHVVIEATSPDWQELVAIALQRAARTTASEIEEGTRRLVAALGQSAVPLGEETAQGR
jgi:Kef-type K+ transport system membrane component KefB